MYCLPWYPLSSFDSDTGKQVTFHLVFVLRGCFVAARQQISQPVLTTPRDYSALISCPPSGVHTYLMLSSHGFRFSAISSCILQHPPKQRPTRSSVPSRRKLGITNSKTMVFRLTRLWLPHAPSLRGRVLTPAVAFVAGTGFTLFG